jgi:threonine aldolase
MADSKSVFDQSINRLPGHGLRLSAKEALIALVDGMDGSEDQDHYGEGEYLDRFETEVAEMFGKEAGVFMPSGTMAQQIAMRLWCEETGNDTIAMHPTAHLEYAEQLGYQFLHSIKRQQFGVPEILSNRMLKVEDFESLGCLPGLVLLELPYRPLGGQLPTWDELVKIREWALSQDIPMHLDGARIWQCTSFYGKTLQQIAELFESVYVSFYKDLGGLCGSMLMGSSAFIKASRVWQRRYGGNLITQSPSVVSARIGLQRSLPQMQSWVARAKQVAAIFSGFEQITVNPDPPHVNFFQLFIQGDHEALMQRHHQLALESETFLINSLTPSAVPGVAMTELHLWENSMDFDIDLLAPFIKRWLA